MSEFHYVRTLGEDGGVDAVDGPAEGMSLDEILKDGLPPYKVALEIVSALCEILDIAEQDEELHGDICASRVFVDDVGAVSIEGFGVERAFGGCCRSHHRESFHRIGDSFAQSADGAAEIGGHLGEIF